MSNNQSTPAVLSLDSRHTALIAALQQTEAPLPEDVAEVAIDLWQGMTRALYGRGLADGKTLSRKLYDAVLESARIELRNTLPELDAFVIECDVNPGEFAWYPDGLVLEFGEQTHWLPASVDDAFDAIDDIRDLLIRARLATQETIEQFVDDDGNPTAAGEQLLEPLLSVIYGTCESIWAVIRLGDDEPTFRLNLKEPADEPQPVAA